MNIDRRVVRVIPVSDLVRARTRLDLQMGHMKTRSIYQLRTTRPVVINRKNEAVRKRPRRCYRGRCPSIAAGATRRRWLPKAEAKSRA